MLVCVIDRQTDRQTHRHTDTQTHRHTDTQTVCVCMQEHYMRRVNAGAPYSTTFAILTALTELNKVIPLTNFWLNSAARALHALCECCCVCACVPRRLCCCAARTHCTHSFAYLALHALCQGEHVCVCVCARARRVRVRVCKHACMCGAVCGGVKPRALGHTTSLRPHTLLA